MSSNNVLGQQATEDKKEQLRVLISNIYDLQKLRISVGNRLVQSIYIQMGVRPGMSPLEVKQAIADYFQEYKRDTSILEQAILKQNAEEAKKANDGKTDDERTEEELNKEEVQATLDEGKSDAELKKERKAKVKKIPSILDLALDDYKLIKKQLKADGKNDSGAGDAIGANIASVKNVINKINQQQANGSLGFNIIRDINDVNLITPYILLVESEKDSVKSLTAYVEAHPMWDRFFKDIKGCGVLMSAVCLAYLDPYKARHVSCFFRYAGLDTVADTVKKSVDGGKEESYPVYFDPENRSKKLYEVVDGTDVKYFDCETDQPYTGNTENLVESRHGRRKGDTVDQTYYVIDEKTGQKVLATEADGTPKLKKGISYNPKLKTKLMGVLTGCLIKAKDPVYDGIYRDQRTRLENSAMHKDTSLAQKNMMAQRYMIKEFLRALWISWRELEGLPVDEPYEVAKLGNKPHKYNEYQCDVAKRYNEKNTGKDTAAC